MKRTKTGVDFAKRWMADVPALTSEFVHELSANGRAAFRTSPFGENAGLADFRGFPLHAAQKLSKKTFDGVDLTGASFDGAWLQDCTFRSVKFERASLKGVKDHGNRFEGCSFEKASFFGAGLGYRQSMYSQCMFEETDFRRATFLAARFHSCQFVKAQLKGLDFYASSFTGCSFTGRLDGVWFRGEYPSLTDAAEFGDAERNIMRDVSFSDAELIGVNFTGGCDLSTIVLPKLGEYRLYRNWRARLLQLAEACPTWPVAERKEAEVFVQSYLESSLTQDWMLLNVAELSEEFGLSLASRIFRILDSS
jgi:uncharacterized protein YjbI with pentapeptide repeats